MVKKDINQPEFVPQGVQPISRVSHCHARAARGWTMLNKHGQEPGTPQLLMMVYPPKVADERSMDLMYIIYIYIYTRCPKTLQTIHFGVPPFQETSIHILYQNRKRKKNSCGIPHLFRQPNDFFSVHVAEDHCKRRWERSCWHLRWFFASASHDCADAVYPYVEPITTYNY